LLHHGLGRIEHARALRADQLIERGLAAGHLGARRRQLILVGASA
jgi:hypothetical protein